MADALNEIDGPEIVAESTQRLDDMFASAWTIRQCRLAEPFYKRPMDIILALVGLILSGPLWVLIAVAIVIDDGFPIIIRQSRVGWHGRHFISYKFRSMIKTSLQEKVNIQACNNDFRITRVGRILRSLALDELPQLLNILVGHMSFVGPRALLRNEIEINGDSECTDVKSIPGHSQRSRMRPGLTGIAQIYAPRDVSRKLKFRYDLLYMEKIGFLMDLMLIAVSFLVTFNMAWEKRCTKLAILKKFSLLSGS